MQRDRTQQDRRVAAIGLLVLGALVLSGCTGPSADFSDLQKDREAQDELPALDEAALASIDAQTSRYAGEHKGTSLWLVEGRTDSRVCLVAASDDSEWDDSKSDDSEWTMACGGGAGLETTSALGRFTVVPDSVPAPDEATAISENVYVPGG